jgi:uncharacterized protein with von Willebrand factor type A (vWA) domain
LNRSHGNLSPGSLKETLAPGLAGRVVLFSQFLKDRGFRVFQSSVLDALRSLQFIEMEGRKDFLAVLRANLTHTDTEWAQFEDLFEIFWGREEDPEEDRGPKEKHFPGAGERVCSPAELVPDADRVADPEAAEGTKELLEGVAYSPVSRVEKKDLACFDRADIQVAQLALKKMMEPFRIHRSRRTRRSRSASRMDFRRVMRKSLRTGGLPVELFYREKRRRLKRLVILADVSGSMDRYARVVMPFILGLRGIGPKAEVFVFSTSLACISGAVRRMSIEKALERLVREFPEWSGGTRIGYALHQFNAEQGQRLLNQKTVVLIMSDGWDLGGRDLLRREMAALSRKAHCVIWLNPLAGDPAYGLVSGGMKAALPYVDYLLAANSLESLKRVGRLLSRVMVP